MEDGARSLKREKYAKECLLTISFMRSKYVQQCM